MMQLQLKNGCICAEPTGLFTPFLWHDAVSDPQTTASSIAACFIKHATDLLSGSMELTVSPEHAWVAPFLAGHQAI